MIKPFFEACGAFCCPMVWLVQKQEDASQDSDQDGNQEGIIWDAVVWQYEAGYVNHGMVEHNCENAFSGIIVKPDHHNPRRNGKCALPDHPCRGMAGLEIRHDMPGGPDASQEDAGFQCSPSLLEWVDRVSHPT